MIRYVVLLILLWHGIAAANTMTPNEVLTIQSLTTEPEPVIFHPSSPLAPALNTPVFVPPVFRKNNHHNVFYIPYENPPQAPANHWDYLFNDTLIDTSLFNFSNGLQNNVIRFHQKQTSNIPFGTCDANTDPYGCAEPIIHDFSTQTHWLKPGRIVNFGLSISNYSEATLAGYNYYTRKLTIIQQWKAGVPRRIFVRNTTDHIQQNDTIYHLEVKNPHGFVNRSINVFNFRLGTTSAAFPSANKNKPQLFNFKAIPNPVSLNSPTALRFSFIGADEYFLMINNALVSHKSGLDPDSLQEFRHRDFIGSPLTKNPHLVLVRNLSNDPEKNQRIEKTLPLKISPPAEIIEFSSDKTSVKAGEKVGFRIKVKGATHIFLDMQEEGGTLTTMPLTPVPQMPLQRNREYRFTTFMNMFSNTRFLLRISNPDSGEPVTKTINIAVGKNFITDQLSILSLSAPKRFAAGQKFTLWFSATNAERFKLTSNETFQGPGTGPDIASGKLVLDNLGVATKSVPITLDRPASELTLEVFHKTGGSVKRSIPINMYWKVKYEVPLNVSRISPLPRPHVDKLHVTCRVGDRYLESNFSRLLPASRKRENYITRMKGKDQVEVNLAAPRYHSGFGSHYDAFHYLLKFEQELEFKPNFNPKLVPFTCSFGSAKICEWKDGKWQCGKWDKHTKYAKSYKELYDRPIDPKYYHTVDFTKHQDFSTPYEFRIKQAMSWTEKP